MVEFVHPAELFRRMDFSLKDDPEPDEALLQLCRQTIHYSVKSGACCGVCQDAGRNIPEQRYEQRTPDINVKMTLRRYVILDDVVTSVHLFMSCIPNFPSIPSVIPAKKKERILPDLACCGWDKRTCLYLCRISSFV